MDINTKAMPAPTTRSVITRRRRAIHDTSAHARRRGCVDNIYTMLSGRGAPELAKIEECHGSVDQFVLHYWPTIFVDQRNGGLRDLLPRLYFRKQTLTLLRSYVA